jgi:hypothetical protein
MRRTLLSVALGLFVGGVTAAVGFAATSPNFHQSPTCSFSTSGASASTTCTGTLFGVGNETLEASTIVSGSATYTCQNGGGNTAPGQNQVTVGPSQSQPVDISSADRNGSATFTTNENTLTAESTVTGKQAGCPNRNWTGVNPQLTVTSVELLITQGNRKIYDCTVQNPGSQSGTLIFPTSC